MRKLKLQNQISIDGLISTGPSDEQHWVTWAWEETRPYTLALLDAADTLLIGRKLAVDYIPYWQGVRKDQPDHPMYELAERNDSYQKVVFTKTLDAADPQVQNWNNTILAKGDLVEEVKKLKSLPGKDMLVYGGSSFVSSLVKENLIDEYHLFINPVAIGRGDGIFGQLDSFRKFRLAHSTVLPCGIVILQYQ